MVEAGSSVTSIGLIIRAVFISVNGHLILAGVDAAGAGSADGQTKLFQLPPSTKTSNCNMIIEMYFDAILSRGK